MSLICVGSPTYGGFPPYLDLVSFGLILVDVCQMLLKSLSLSIESRIVLHLFVFPWVPFLVFNEWCNCTACIKCILRIRQYADTRIKISVYVITIFNTLF